MVSLPYPPLALKPSGLSSQDYATQCHNRIWQAELQTHLAANDLVIRRLAGIGIRPRYWPAALLASGLLKLGRISYAAAGQRIHLEVTDSPRLEMIGYATKVGP